MANQVNPDGTVQVPGLPPLESAFGPASASAPPPPMQAPAPGAPPTPGAGDPSFAGAIMALIHSLAGNFAPKSIVDAQKRPDREIDRQSK